MKSIQFKMPRAKLIAVLFVAILLLLLGLIIAYSALRDKSDTSAAEAASIREFKEQRLESVLSQSVPNDSMDKVQYHSDLAYAYGSLGRFEEAIKANKAAIEVLMSIDPRDDDMKVRISNKQTSTARLCQAANKNKEAIVYLQQSIQTLQSTSDPAVYSDAIDQYRKQIEELNNE